MPVQPIPAADDFSGSLLLSSPQATTSLGEKAAQRLQGGEIILLWGPLGAGKTCFVQGLCRGLGVAEEVTSPTFTLVNSYDGRLVIHHSDFFRIGSKDALTDIGVDGMLDDVAEGRAILVAEWPLPIVDLLDSRLELLVLPGSAAQDRSWHLRGIPELPVSWRDFLEPE